MSMSPEQKSAWLSERAGKLTASSMWRAMSFLKNGSPSSERTKYMYELLAERVTGFSVPHFVTPAMQEGIDYEDEAIDFFVERYPQYNPCTSRFYEHPTIPNFGASPDRELDTDWLIEAKVPQPTTFMEWCITGVTPEKHRPQMTAQLLCTGRTGCIFLAYCPHIKDEKRRLFLRKYTPTAEELRAVEVAAVNFLDELDAMFDLFVSQP